MGVFVWLCFMVAPVVDVVLGFALGIVRVAVVWFVVGGWVRRSRQAGCLWVVSLSLVCVLVLAPVG